MEHSNEPNLPQELRGISEGGLLKSHQWHHQLRLRQCQRLPAKCTPIGSSRSKRKRLSEIARQAKSELGLEETNSGSISSEKAHSSVSWLGLEMPKMKWDIKCLFLVGTRAGSSG